MLELDPQGVMLAVTPPAPAPGRVAGSDTTQSTGTAAGGNGAAPAGGRGPDLLLPLLAVMIVFMLIFSILGQRKERKKREALINAIGKHDKVQTIGGVIGSIVEVSDQEVVLKVDESSNTRIRFARTAIQQVLEGSSKSGSKS